jgi:hypothetical protein
MNFDLKLILTIIASLVGAPALIAFVIDVLKWAGVVTDGNSAKWSAGLNALVLIVVAVASTFFPNFDIKTTDVMLLNLVQFAGLLFAYVVQIFVSNQTHNILPLFSFSKKAALPLNVKQAQPK